MQTSQKLNYSHNKTRSHLLLKANLQSQQKPLPQQIQEMSQNHYNSHNRSMTTIITENMG